MSQHNVHLFNWNVRGLNAQAKQDVVKAFVHKVGASIVCLQETKLATVTDRNILSILGQNFVQSYAFLPASGTRGGIILACNANLFSLSEAVQGQFSLSATITMFEEGLQWSITVVYSPQLEADKIAFLAEIEAMSSFMKPAWLLIGDFNLIYKVSDKNNDRLNRRMMQRFKGLIDKIEVKELHLPGRRFTWAGAGQNPTQTKIDRAFVIPDWDIMFSNASLQPLSSSTSDHAALFLIGNEMRGKPPNSRFEAFWLKIPGFLEVVEDSWNRPLLAANPLAILYIKLKRLARDLKRWNRQNVGDIKLQLAVANEVVFQLDVAQETRPLSDDECVLRSNLKARILGLAVLNKIQIRQRSRLTWLKEGDVNSKFFHIKENSRRRKNFIQTLQTQNGIAVSAQEKADTLFRFFSDRLGTPSQRQSCLNWATLNFPSFDLDDQEDDITEEELKHPVFSVPSEKAPGPDGYIGAFFKHAWEIIKEDLLLAAKSFMALNTNQLKKLNTAYICLLPKKRRSGWTKLLANRLAPRLNELVSQNQSAFVRKRAIHDNFLFVQNLVHILHRNHKEALFLKVHITKAFDTVGWPYLLEVLQRYGFGTRWRNWVSNLLATSSSQILLNGSPGASLPHARGL